ncbi:MAG: hypothetical protein ABI822_11185 [Bryobacteraceae bacterium]
MTVFAAASQSSPGGMTYALRTAGDPLSFVSSVHQIVRQADSRIPVTNVVTQAAEIDRTISRELTFAKLCAGFAALSLLTACVGLYGTMSAPWPGWCCAASYSWLPWDSPSACLPRWARSALSNRFCSPHSPMIPPLWGGPLPSS